MPNEVFLRTRSGLSTLVSTRAASRILEGALRGLGNSPEDVSLDQMRTALTGPVLHELEGVLPQSGLRRTLERLARDLSGVRASEASLVPAAAASPTLDAPRAPAAAPVSAATASPTTDASPAPAASPVPVDRSATEAVGAPHDPASREAAAPFAAGVRTTDPAADGRAQPPVELRSAPAPAPSAGSLNDDPAAADGAARRARVFDDELLERWILRFAQIEQVRLVAAVRADGEIAVRRGEGPDLVRLARLSRLALALMRKGGAVRSFHLGHSAGQLFLFPVGSDLLVVFASAESNIGAVTTAFTALALEEDL